MGKGVRGSTRKAPRAEEGFVNDGIHPGERVSNQGKLGDLRQIVYTLVHAVTKQIPGGPGRYVPQGGNRRGGLGNPLLDEFRTEDLGTDRSPQ